MENPSNSPAPFLTKFAVPRISGAAIDGRYSNEMDVWVTEDSSGVTPIVTAKNHMSELMTKTDVQQESDDASKSVGDLLELVTKTATVQETDDENFFRAGLLELETKTEQQVESDDQSRPLL